MLKLKVLVRSLGLLQVYAPNATSEYQTFVDEVNDALLRVSATESTVLMGDFNAHVGIDTDTWKGVIGKHGVTGLNEVEASHAYQRWSPRGQILKSLTSKVKSLALASRPQILENWPVLGSRTAVFFELLKFCGAFEKFFGKRFFVEIA